MPASPSPSALSRNLSANADANAGDSPSTRLPGDYVGAMGPVMLSAACAHRHTNFNDLRDQVVVWGQAGSPALYGFTNSGADFEALHRTTFIVYESPALCTFGTVFTDGTGRVYVDSNLAGELLELGADPRNRAFSGFVLQASKQAQAAALSQDPKDPKDLVFRSLQIPPVPVMGYGGRLVGMFSFAPQELRAHLPGPVESDHGQLLYALGYPDDQSAEDAYESRGLRYEGIEELFQPQASRPRFRFR